MIIIEIWIREPAISHLDVLCLVVLRYILFLILCFCILFIYIMCTCAHTCTVVLVWRPDNGFWKPGFSSHHVGPRDGTQILRLVEQEPLPGIGYVF